MRWLRAVADLLLPPLCRVCRQPGELPVCGVCRAQFPLIRGPVCRRCGLPAAVQPPASALCLRCRVRPGAYSCARGVGLFEGRLREAIHVLKFGRCRAMASVLGMDMAELVARTPELQADIIVPVPLHPRRLRARGFNQARLLAEEIARRGYGVVNETVLARARETRFQSELNREERALNVRGAFDARQAPGATRVLLVDDVMSTGATASACALALRRVGVHETGVVVAALAPLALSVEAGVLRRTMGAAEVTTKR